MRTAPTRRQIETAAAALLAAAAGAIGIAGRGAERVGPKFLALEKIGRFKEPIDLTQAPHSDLLFVAERPGRIAVVERGGIRRRPFLDISDLVEGGGNGRERGLLSLAFAPDYVTSGRFYVAYTAPGNRLDVVEYRRSAGSRLEADPDSARTLLSVAEPTGRADGGMLAFGPDGYLYIGVGSGGPPGDPLGLAQDRSVLNGKLLRIDPTPSGGLPYSIPADNPFVGAPGRDEIYAYGLRDPWRFSFDRATGALAIGDVGENRFQEVDYLLAGQAAGANFGWNAYEGFEVFGGGPPKLPRDETVKPIYAYPRRRGCAITGGYVVRDPSLTRIAGRELVGRYLFGDYCSGRVYAFRAKPKRAGKVRKLRFRVPVLASFAQDDAGRIYLISQRGNIWRLVPQRKRG